MLAQSQSANPNEVFSRHSSGGDADGATVQEKAQMRLALTASLIGLVIVTLPGTAFAVQTGKIYKSAEGEWMCIDKWGNEIPPSTTGGWTVVSPPRQIGGACNNQRVVADNGPVTFHQPAIDVIVTPPKGGQTKSISEQGVR
jgi:hypothetical protein